MDKNIFCVIPAFNEEATIYQVIKDVKKHLDNIVVVDDGSSDNTYNIAKSCNVKVLRHIINRGQGAALMTGNQFALRNRADIIVHFDADGQFNADEINQIIDPIIQGRADVVFGSRFLGKNSDLPVFKEKIILPLGRIVNKILIGKSLTDPQNGFRALSRKAAKLIEIDNDGMAHNSEIQYKTFKNKLRFSEVPVTVKYNEFGQGFFKGKGRGSGGLKVIKDLLIQKILD
jgi:glycosyltransferase involved in cell wall biosynthesis